MYSNSRWHGTADFSKWQLLRPAVAPEALRFLGITPFERPDFSLGRAFVRQRATLAIDIGRESSRWQDVLEFLSQHDCLTCGIRVPDHVEVGPEYFPDGLSFVVLSAERNLTEWVERFPVIVQVTSVQEASAAIASGALGLIAKGQDSGGAVGEESSFILLQRIVEFARELRIPVWCQGGIGFHTAAGAIAGGAFGVVLDSQLALLAESSLDPLVKAEIAGMDGSEARLAGGYVVYSRPGLGGIELSGVSAPDVRARMISATEDMLWPIGQDSALAKEIAAQCSNVEALLKSMRVAVAGHLRQATALNVLGEGNALARAHGTRYGVAQGPMTRVSDTAAFSAAVAENGALPFLALSLMRDDSARKLLEETRLAVGKRSWGVGVLGFAPPEILNPHLALIREFRPTAVLLAGGRPSQSRALVEEGIPAYLHVPSPGLLGLFLKDGARHFVFEGRECGGHVGPRFSFVLWEQQMRVLLGFDRADELHVMFAGGIHDARSAAMVAAIAAPLAARGAKIGVLMGSAYITTREAVACGAVTEGFQAQVLSGNETVLLETAPGHATRCLRSQFVDFFEAEKQRLNAEGRDAQSIWKYLEELNVGRLRVATKGVQRIGDKLVDVDTRDQLAEGMYMIGQVAVMHDAVRSMAALHQAVSGEAMALLADCQPPMLPQSENADPIAVIGMACVYPGSPDLESYWANIVEGRNLVSEVPPDRWNVDLYYQNGSSEKGKTPSKWGGFINEVAFDPLRYGIPPQSLAAIEPVQLLSLEVASRALIDAGYGEDGEASRYYDREKTSVIFGAESGMDLSNAYAFRSNYSQYLGEMPAELDQVLPDLTEDSFPGVLVNVISGRVANRLGLGGVNYSVDSACASSLTAIEVAVKELRTGSSDMVLAGGADFHNSIHDFLMFASVKALSPSGLCRSFDDSADGICLGEGVGVVVLKRLVDAERDGDRIYAVIKGIAGSSDGKGLGLTAPRKEGQKRALERAYWQGGVMPGSVGLVEAHGTGTVVGDRTELQTMTEIFNAGGALPLAAGLGSVKSQIGHTKCAAGIAGFIKVAKSLYHRVLPPTLHIEKPNAGYDPFHSPFMLNRSAQPWPTEEAFGAVSAFGFGGTNFHAVLSAHGSRKTMVSGVPQWPAELFLFHGDSFETVARFMQLVGKFLRESDAELRLRDLAYSVSKSGDGPVLCAIVARDIADLVFKLECAHLREKHEGVYYRQHESHGKVAFVFPGQGSQSPGMLRDLFVAFPFLHSVLDAGAAWCGKLFPPTAYEREQQHAQQRAVTDTRVAQPVLGMANFAMARLLESLNIKPDMVAGHSYGELVALAVAGCFDLPELLRLSESRGISILEAVGDDPGRMVAVSEGRAVLERLFPSDGGIVLANQNSPDQTVISGATGAIEAALATLKQRGIAARPIEVACAFHSPLVASAEVAFSSVLNKVSMASPVMPVYSNVTAHPYCAGIDEIHRQLSAQIVSPVRFVDMIEQMHADGARVFIEAGPGRVLTGLIQKILAGRPHLVVSLDQKGQPGLPNLLDGLAQLAVALSDIDTAILWSGRGVAGLNFEQPAKIPAACWMVDGARAKPRSGEPPRHAGKIVRQPLRLSISGASKNLRTTADQAVFHYLGNMRDLVQAQRDVMLSLLGDHQAAAPLSSGLAETPVQLTDGSTGLKASANIESSVMAPLASIRDTLLSIVSERTGYPVDMLDPELDLEADLSIDSIKRIEIMGELGDRIGLRQRLGSQADAMLEQLASQKTLHSIVAWLQDKLPGLVHSGVSAVTKSEASTPSSTIARLDTRQVLLGIVSQRTGYPEDVLDLDLDLEADLSIDSIKRLEIVGELSERLGLHNLLRDKDAVLDNLAALKTLRAIVDWLKANVERERADTSLADQDGAVELAAIGGSVLTDESAGMRNIGLSRYVLRTVEAPEAIRGQHEFSGKRFLITDDELGVAPNLARRLEARGALVRVIGFSEHAAQPDDLEHIDGLIHLFNLNPVARVRDVKRFFSLVRETLLNKASYLLVASGLGGNFGRSKERQLPDDFGHGAGMAGMVKSVAKEWPEVCVHYVDLDLTDSVQELAAYLEIELLAENQLTEVGYHDGGRHLLKVVESKLPLPQEFDQLDLDRDSVILLTGGARGITAQLAVALARRYGCQLELVGRSPMPANEDDEEFSSATDLKSLRQHLIRKCPELKPIDVEQQCSSILAEREIRRTFAEIEAVGGRVRYSALDVRDIDAFGCHIEGLYHRYGRIDGVIHGAGVVEDKLLRHKSIDSFQRVFDTKVRGALMLYKLLRDDIKFVVFFSSVAGAFGNRGQVDYASANDVLDKIAHALRTRIKGRVLSVNWGPWAGTGMVSPELEREYARKGIGLIPINVGVDALLQELQFGTREDTQVVFMCATPESMDMAY